ncbi:ankyrin repeat domain-containing protein 26-like [Heliangelus exortis]|uniref:ankyrin repeat domain-containing protein 26-like n=1 Tax=Heliangelus exortis TaxID=472823 RepID=UPI003A8F8599
MQLGEHSGRTSHISLSAEKEVFKDSIENSVMQERLAQLQRQNLLLQLKLEDRKKQQLIKENVVTVAQDSCFMGNFKKLSAYAEQKVSLAQERNKELYENCNLLRKQVFKCEIDKVELECKIRELQLELADALKKLSMAEASLDLTMRCSRNLEEAKLGLQKELGECRQQVAGPAE